MSEHFNKLACGPRAIMVVAKKFGKPIDPDAMWKKFFAADDQSIAHPGAIYISQILEIVKEYGVASEIEVTQDIDRAGLATVATNVSGILMTTERLPNSSGEGFSSQRHLWAVNQILVGNQNEYFVELESANRGEDYHIQTLPDVLLIKMLRTFLILVK